MTEEQINQKALEVIPPNLSEIDGYDWNENERDGYIKALKEIEELPKIKGWVARDKVGWGNSKGWLRLHFRKPERTVRSWDSVNEFLEDESQTLNSDMFPELTWESEPVEVELLIRKI